MSRNSFFLAEDGKGYQLEEDSIELLLLKLRSQYPQLHTEEDRTIRIDDEYSDMDLAYTLKRRFEHDVDEALQIKQYDHAFVLKLLPILNHTNGADLLSWINSYQQATRQFILYGIVHVSMNHWVPYFILPIEGRLPKLLTIEPMAVPHKQGAVSCLHDFFLKIFQSDALFDFQNIDIDLQANGYACGMVSYNLLDEVLASLSTKNPILIYEGQDLRFKKALLRHQKGHDDLALFKAKTERLCGGVLNSLKGYGNIIVSSAISTDDKIYRKLAIHKLAISEGVNIKARIQKQLTADERRKRTQMSAFLVEDPKVQGLINEVIKRMSEYPSLQAYKQNKMSLLSRLINWNHNSQPSVIDLLNCLQDIEMSQYQKIKRICIEFLMCSGVDWRGDRLRPLLVDYFKVSTDEVCTYIRRRLSVTQQMSMTYSDEYYTPVPTHDDYAGVLKQKIKRMYRDIEGEVKHYRISVLAKKEAMATSAKPV